MGGIFSKFLLDAGCDNLPKSAKKPFLKKCGLRPFVSSQSICSFPHHILLSRRQQLKISRKRKGFRLGSANSMLLKYQKPFITPFKIFVDIVLFSLCI